MRMPSLCQHAWQPQPGVARCGARREGQKRRCLCFSSSRPADRDGWVAVLHLRLGE